MNEILEFLCRFLDHDQDYACLASLKAKPLFLNKAARKLLGIDAGGEAPSLGMSDLYDEPTWTRLREEAFPAVRESGHWEGEGRLRHISTMSSA